MMNLLTIVAALVQPCHQGLRVMPGVLASIRQEEGLHLSQTGILVASQWCSHDLQVCVDDPWTGCPIEECTHCWLIFAPEGAQWMVRVTSSPNIPVSFMAIEPMGAVQTGVCAGPWDWNLDGVKSCADFYAYIEQFAAGTADHNLDGVTDSADLFLFLADFFG